MQAKSLRRKVRMFLIGSGTAVTLYGKRLYWIKRETKKQPKENDFEALALDWKTVGEDIQEAMNAVGR